MKWEEVPVRKALRARRSVLKKPIKLIRQDFVPCIQKYKQHHKTFGELNNFSKTDPDTTFMRMKDDHMKNLEKLANSDLPIPKTVVADAGYGSEENYLYALGEEKEPRFEFLIPYGTYVKEQTRKYWNDIKNVKNWTYEEEDDRFICPNGRRAIFKKYQKGKNASGRVKGNRSFRSFSMRGLNKVHVEFGIVALAHNLLKVAGIRQLHSEGNRKNLKVGRKNMFFSTYFYLRAF